jgi:hypothetical protein
MRVSSLGLVSAMAVLMLISVVPAGAVASGSGDYPYSGSGTWRISRDTEVSGETVIVNGDLIIEDGARLLLSDSTIVINCTSPEQYKVVVRPAASLELVRSRIVPLNASYHFKLVVEEPPAQAWPLSADISFLVGIMVGLGIAFPIGIAVTAFLYKKWFSRNLPPPV